MLEKVVSECVNEVRDSPGCERERERRSCAVDMRVGLAKTMTTTQWNINTQNRLLIRELILFFDAGRSDLLWLYSLLGDDVSISLVIQLYFQFIFGTHGSS